MKTESKRHDKTNNIDATTVSWMDNLTTKRTYRLDGKEITIVNDYQKISCVHCNKPIFARLTRISFGKNNFTEFHINYNKSLQKLKKLLITYFPVKEIKIKGQYCLVCKNKIIQTEKNPNRQTRVIEGEMPTSFGLMCDEIMPKNDSKI